MKSIDLDEGTFTLASGTGAGAVKRVDRFNLVGATVHATMSSGNYTLQGSNDGTNWLDVAGGAITASGMTKLDANYRLLRILTNTAGDGEFVLFAHE